MTMLSKQVCDGSAEVVYGAVDGVSLNCEKALYNVL
jgi:hypothetical protein